MTDSPTELVHRPRDLSQGDGLLAILCELLDAHERELSEARQEAERMRVQVQIHSSAERLIADFIGRCIDAPFEKYLTMCRVVVHPSNQEVQFEALGNLPSAAEKRLPPFIGSQGLATLYTGSMRWPIDFSLANQPSLALRPGDGDRQLTPRTQARLPAHADSDPDF